MHLLKIYEEKLGFVVQGDVVFIIKNNSRAIKKIPIRIFLLEVNFVGMEVKMEP